MHKAYADVVEFNEVAMRHMPKVPMLPVMGESIRWWIADLAETLHRKAETAKSMGVFADRSVGDRIALLRAQLMCEELSETLRALAEGDAIGVADGLADSIYVTLDAAVAFGIDMGPVWDEVQRANMAKFPPCGDCRGTGNSGMGISVPESHCETCRGTGRVAIIVGGKIQKPKGWTPPDIAGVLARQQGGS